MLFVARRLGKHFYAQRKKPLDFYCTVSASEKGGFLMNDARVKEGWVKTLWRYYRFPGSWAWILHRISGLVLTGYIILHIYALTTLQQGEKAFNEEMALFLTPIFKLLEWFLFAFVVFHTLNGIRIVLIDFADASKYQKVLYRWVWVLSIISFFGIGWFIMFG